MCRFHFFSFIRTSIWHPDVSIHWLVRTSNRRGEDARDEDGDGFCEVHVNTIEGFWSLLQGVGGACIGAFPKRNSLAPRFL